MAVLTNFGFKSAENERVGILYLKLLQSRFSKLRQHVVEIALEYAGELTIFRLSFIQFHYGHTEPTLVVACSSILSSPRSVLY